MQRKQPSPGMSEQQRRFAEDHAASRCVASIFDRQLAFIYHEDESATDRWLVDRSGHVIEFTRFHKSSAGPPWIDPRRYSKLMGVAPRPLA